MAADQDGELWIGTDEGLVVLYSPSNIFNGGNSDARPILFEEDGVVQKLLGETPITSIFVDGGNRKWIGTRGAGLFLVSPEGLQTLLTVHGDQFPFTRQRHPQYCSRSDQRRASDRYLKRA
jgi:ligand-binding sensor domain-containing protein